jgi:para-aminobenzoate synthetase component 1
LPRLLFLDSSLVHNSLGRYSFVTADPFEWIQARRNRIHISGDLRRAQTGNPFDVLAERLACFRMEPVAGLPPFQGGIAGLFGYGLCHQLEELPRSRTDEFRAPDLAVGFYDWVLAFDHVAQRAWLVSTGLPGTDPGGRRLRARRRLRSVKGLLANSAPGPGIASRSWPTASSVKLADQHSVPGYRNVLSNFDRSSYMTAVRRVLEYIAAGDCFQVNLAQRLLHPVTVPPLELYRKLRERNPATFSGYVDAGEFIIASASPERFLRVENGEVETRPIKGTRPRGQTPEEDRRQMAELLGSAKDNAENVMIVDLLRNDLGRVCRYGSIRVPAVCCLETYPFVHHLVSEVRGQLRDELGPLDLLRAAFPGGSVTGAPKIRAMEIIAELEPSARGPYCGSLGYLGFDGSMDTNILIRTFTVGRGWLQFPVGGGIVADSVPEREYEETWHKAEGLLRALE